MLLQSCVVISFVFGVWILLLLFRFIHLPFCLHTLMLLCVNLLNCFEITVTFSSNHGCIWGHYSKARLLGGQGQGQVTLRPCCCPSMHQWVMQYVSTNLQTICGNLTKFTSYADGRRSKFRTRILAQEICPCVISSRTSFFSYQKLGWIKTVFYSVRETWSHMIEMLRLLVRGPFCFLRIFCCWLLLVISSFFVFLAILLIMQCYPEKNKIWTSLSSLSSAVFLVRETWVVLCATCIQVSCAKFLVRVSCTRNLDRLPSALGAVGNKDKLITFRAQKVRGHSKDAFSGDMHIDWQFAVEYRLVKSKE